MIGPMLTALVFASVIPVTPPEQPTGEAAAQYEAKCAGKSTPECKQLQWRIEYALYEDMAFLATKGPLDDDLVQAGLVADCPQLKALALTEIHHRGLKPAEHPHLIAALNDPYPLVRFAARQMVGQLPDEKYSRMLLREANYSSNRPQRVTGVTARPQPDAKALGAPVYPGSTYWYFASSEDDGDFFTSPDSVEKVLAHFSKGGKKSHTGAELKAKVEAARKAPEQDPMAIARMMQEAMAAGQDPSKMMESLSKGDTSQNWTSGLEGKEKDGILKPRYVVLEESKFFNQNVPARIVVVFKDEVMGGTAMVFRHVKQRPAMPTGNKKELEAWQRAQKILSQPDAKIEN